MLTLQPTAAETYGPPVVLRQAVGDDRLRVAVADTRRGPTSIRVEAVDARGRPVRLASLSGALSSATVAALDVDFRRSGDGWVSTDAQAPLPGTWTLTLQVGVDATSGFAVAASWPVW